MFSDYIKVDGVKLILGAAHLPKKGKKQEIVDRLSGHMEALYNAKNVLEYNRLVAEVNRLRASPGMLHGRSSFRRRHRFLYEFPDEAAISELYRQSKLKEFKFPLPAGYTAERAMSDPLYLDQKCPSLTNLEMTFTTAKQYVRHAVAGQKHTFLALVLLRVYETAEPPSHEIVRFRFARGMRLPFMSLNENRIYTAHHMPSHSKFPHVILHNAVIGLNKLQITVDGSKIPNYYLQVFEITHDPTVISTQPAALVKKEYLERTAKSEIETSSLQLSLRCPLSLIRMTVPVRFSTCKHLQCMELSAWQSYSSANTYGKAACPVCNKPGTMLIKDGFTLEILEAVPESVDTVTLDVENNLAWSLAKPGSTSVVGSPIASEPASEVDIEHVCIDLTEDNTVYDSPWEPPVPVKAEPALPAEAKAFTQPLPSTAPMLRSRNSNLVDLTDADEAIERRLASQHSPRRIVQLVIELD